MCFCCITIDKTTIQSIKIEGICTFSVVHPIPSYGGSSSFHSQIQFSEFGIKSEEEKSKSKQKALFCYLLSFPLNKMHFEKANYFKFLWRSHLHPGLILHPGFDTVSVVILFWHCIPVHFVVKLSSPVSVLLINSVICLVIYLIVWSRVNPPSSFFSLFFFVH